MRKWTKEYKQFIGRVIFANFLKLPLKKYKNIVEEAERAVFDEGCGSSLVAVKRLSQAKAAYRKEKKSSKVIAEIVKRGKSFSVRYTYEGFNRIYQISHNPRKFALEKSANISVIYKLRRISSRNEITHKILKGIIKHQRRYLKTGNLNDLATFSQARLVKWINKDLYSVSRRPYVETEYEILNTKCGICNSWTSRLVNGLSVIIPSGEEKPLKWFFQTRKDINKRLIKQILDEENEDLESGKLKKPYTDNELRAMLEVVICERYFERRAYSVERIGEKKLSANKISRHSVGHCRKEMGIPTAKRRLSGYKYPPLSANFSLAYPLIMESVIKHAPVSSGVYELSIRPYNVVSRPYTVKNRDTVYGIRTAIFYIGSAKNIKKRLREHLGKNSKNGYIRRFLKEHNCSFRYVQFQKNWKKEEARLYNFFIATYGTPPKCNRVRPGGGVDEVKFRK